ncbi:multicopper oxidase domain-containing protein [Deinococcus metalli]|uniref:multicopper oxidase domain-containing protein n=1 Tax=Deinococcus metalli TaxID=1141878 RepID=UPI003608D54E
MHWHGLILDNAMDGPAIITQPPIWPGEQFTYRFTAVHQWRFHRAPRPGRMTQLSECAGWRPNKRLRSIPSRFTSRCPEVCSSPRGFRCTPYGQRYGRGRATVRTDRVLLNRSLVGAQVEKTMVDAAAVPEPWDFSAEGRRRDRVDLGHEPAP